MDIKETKRILFIGQDYNLTNEGMSMVTRRNHRILTQLGYKIDSILIPPPKTITKLLSILTRRSYGFTSTIERQVEAALNEPYEFIFFDRSIFGDTVRKFSQKGHKIICFFHNVETSLSKARFRVTKNLFYLLLYRNIKYNESLSIKYSDKIIAISDRDLLELQNISSNKLVGLLPTSFLPIEIDEAKLQQPLTSYYCLFVGSDFFANQEGITWFIKEVAPSIDMEVWIVGSICNTLSNMHLPKNVRLLGYAEDLTSLYVNASCVISPIFSGSGLKTKTIEAIRFGKYILGTDEAFVGVDKRCFDKIGCLCNTKEEFIDGIREYMATPRRLNQGSLEVFNTYFSDAVAINTLKKIIER